MTIEEAKSKAYKAHMDYVNSTIKNNFSWSSEQERLARKSWLQADRELDETIQEAIAKARTEAIEEFKSSAK
jgi:hypothetical protein